LLVRKATAPGRHYLVPLRKVCPTGSLSPTIGHCPQPPVLGPIPSHTYQGDGGLSPSPILNPEFSCTYSLLQVSRNLTAKRVRQPVSSGPFRDPLKWDENQVRNDAVQKQRRTGLFLRQRESIRHRQPTLSDVSESTCSSVQPFRSRRIHSLKLAIFGVSVAVCPCPATPYAPIIPSTAALCPPKVSRVTKVLHWP
jgi:hypothetical protein